MDSVAHSKLQLKDFLSSELLDFVYAVENEAPPFSPTFERSFPAPPTNEIDTERAFPAEILLYYRFEPLK